MFAKALQTKCSELMEGVACSGERLLHEGTALQ